MSEEGRDSTGDSLDASSDVDESDAETPPETGGARADEADADADAPVEVGDGRQKHVTVATASGKEISHGDIYLRHSDEEFIVSPEAEFPPAETTRYRKSNLDRVEITQHHSTCFITTATAGDGPTLDVLRGFRDDVMRTSPPGRALLRVYETVSPPIARTLARHPDARSTRLVRSLVERCADVARRREGSNSPVGRTLRSAGLTALYVFGVCVAVVAHLWLSLAGSGREGGRLS